MTIFILQAKFGAMFSLSSGSSFSRMVKVADLTDSKQILEQKVCWKVTEFV